MTPKLYLEPDQLERLKQHKYQSKGTSILEPILQVYWRWLVTKVPLWMAPNLITFIGLVINISTAAPIVILDPNAQGLAPSWSYIACAIGYFIYQSLDAIDGKQARRTNTNNQLGELFDHGCDAISGYTVLFTALSAVGTHDYPLLMLGFSLLLMILNYCYHWQTYVSGILYFKWFDVTEAQLVHIALLLLAGVFGTDVLLYEVPWLNITLRWIVIIGSCGMSLLNLTIAINIIFTCGVGKNGSTVADTSVLSPLLLPILHIIPVILYTSLSLTPLHEYCMLYLMAMVLPLAKAIIHLLIATMTKSPVPLWDIILLGPFLAFLNVYCGSPFPDKYVLIAVMVFNVADISLMCSSVCQQICTFLGIQCFTIPYPPARKKQDPQ